MVIVGENRVKNIWKLRQVFAKTPNITPTIIPKFWHDHTKFNQKLGGGMGVVMG